MSEEISQAFPLVPKGYSLEADMLSGWRPPKYRIPYPLAFNSEFDFSQTSKTIYIGYRPTDSFIIHSEYSDGSENTYPFEYSDPSLVSYLTKKSKNPVIQPFNGMLPGRSEDCLIFDSKFEGGNLDRVEMQSSDEYDLYMRVDTNTTGHMHWFYFSVTGIQHKRTVKFNVVNFTRSTTLYAAGMNPAVFSVQEIKNGNSQGWQLGGEQVAFGPSRLKGLKKKIFSLSFTYKFVHTNDKVWFATAIPYTYCRLEKIFKLLKCHNSQYITTGVLCKSLAMIDIPLITITNPFVPIENKRIIVAVARVHPAETVGSWVMEGFLRFISSKHPEAAMLRNKFIFKIVPMLNPDGVIVGNSRTSMSGNDLNRTYINPDREKHPEIAALKELVWELQSSSKGKVFLFVDMHGHFAKKGSFIYGPHFPMHNSLYAKSKVIPRLIGERTEMFRYYSCKFRVSKNKKKAARAVMNNQMKINYSYTLETSYYGYLNGNRETVPFTPENLFVLGEKFGRSVLEYFSMLEAEREKSQQRKAKSKIFSKILLGTALLNKIIDDFDFEIPHLSFKSTTSHSANPTDTFSVITFKKETHVKRNLDEWIQVKII